jgi:Fur family transcriptional regulator, ferric uptake regulator
MGGSAPSAPDARVKEPVLAPATHCYYCSVDTSYADLMDQLRSRGLRMTPQRRAIVSEILRAKGHISPTEIARKVQDDMPGVNASTVYRTLALLESVGVLQHSHVETGAEYHRASEAHHVHLTCRNCGQDDELSLDEADRLEGLIRRHHGFVADLTHFAITGLCRDCAAA